MERTAIATPMEAGDALKKKAMRMPALKGAAGATRAPN